MPLLVHIIGCRLFGCRQSCDLHQCCCIVNWTIMNKLKKKVTQNTIICILEKINFRNLLPKNSDLHLLAFRHDSIKYTATDAKYGYIWMLHIGYLIFNNMVPIGVNDNGSTRYSPSGSLHNLGAGGHIERDWLLMRIENVGIEDILWRILATMSMLDVANTLKDLTVKMCH